VAELLTDLVYLVGGALPARPIGWVFTDLNGERHRSKEWDFCSIRCSELIMPPKSTIVRLTETWGDTGAASGALAAVYAASGWRAGYAPAPSALIALSSEGDERGVIGLEAPA
jgi:3-oxoacyl-[acyl-carrier-protein] synthase-1